MPAGLPYFAWIDAGETTFTSGHMRWDEAIFSFTLSQEEGDPASLTVAVRRPHNSSGDAIGLLGPGRKIWCWFALDCGGSLITFRGRLVGIPTSIFEELVTLEFVAKPVDLVAQKEALANSLRVLPYYDEAVIDPARRSDPDVVLEGYTAIWHYDRSSHVITVSDEITGEDGLVVFDGVSDTGKILYDGLGLTLTSGPLARVDVNAEYTWTQQAQGTIDLTDYLVAGWPGNINGTIPFKAEDWPKNGSGLGDGWEVVDAHASNLIDYSTHTQTGGSGLTLEEYGGEGASTSVRATVTRTYIGSAPKADVVLPPGGPVIVTDDWSVTYDEEGNGSGGSRNYSQSVMSIVEQAIKPTLVAGYTASRSYTELVSFSLFADVQHILTDPEDGEAIRIDDVKSVNLSESGFIGDSRRRSYIATERGNRSLEHLIALARAHLMKRARVVEITFAPKLARMPEITLRKNVSLIEPRVGAALGKIIGYSIALDGSDGRVDCEVRMGCTIGRGGSHTVSAGEPTYVSVAYVGYDYQQFINRVVMVGDIDTVGYQPPYATPNDDGINFMGVISVGDMIEIPLSVLHGPFPDSDEVEQVPWNGPVTEGNEAARTSYFNNLLKQYETRATFKLKSMSRDFSTDYQLQVTDLKIPIGYDLEAV